MEANKVTFQPGAELLTDLAELRAEVNVCLRRLADGELPTEVERERVDLKEEAGRRGVGGVLLDGTPRNTSAATQLADEVACMANTPGGGALIVGVNDRTGDLIGTDLDPEWLKHQIYRRIDVAPQAEIRFERGIRLVVLLVSEAREPVEDTGDRLRWRVGANCVPVDRSAWWVHRQDRVGWDEMARPSRMTVDDISPGAIAVARDYLRGRPANDGLADESTEELLRRLGLLTVEGTLTQAGALLFCPAPRAWLSWARWNVQGGEVLAATDARGGASLLEQVAQIEALLDGANDRVTLSGSFSERLVRLLPPRAAREAVLNGVVHRDWHQAEATVVTWVEADASLEVVSPGGFVGGVNAGNVLTQRYSRSPALADAVRALGLVDKQGIGVDRMYREMVTLGHRPPLLLEEPGPRVRVRLTGGKPVVPVMRLVDEIEPRERQADVRVAMILHTLLHEPFITAQRGAEVLQRTVQEADEALRVAGSCVVDGNPLIEPYRDVWVLSRASTELTLRAAGDLAALKRQGVLTNLRPDPVEATRVVRQWLNVHDRVSSGDYATLTELTYAGARRALERMVTDGLLERGETAGRNAHFLPTGIMRSGPRKSDVSDVPSPESVEVDG
ncbi:DUF5635 domain-containing protein [Blastococcus sp. DSM 46786]|uniref:DUF5635 domain-containing protein n=1 Tax=Blastococcus sp. DSM 46786 TaxID=1798227 RepID=UPI001B8D6ADE|nr:DUF5635 domain-containing protein [Blastococcus sp. DSM 46786]